MQLTTAQQAKPKVMGQMEPSRAQLTTRSTVDKTYSNNNMVIIMFCLFLFQFIYYYPTCAVVWGDCKVFNVVNISSDFSGHGTVRCSDDASGSCHCNNNKFEYKYAFIVQYHKALNSLKALFAMFNPSAVAILYPLE
jgi:hypothetical protein